MARLGETQCGRCRNQDILAEEEAQEARKVDRAAFAAGYAWITEFLRLGPDRVLTTDEMDAALVAYTEGLEPAEAVGCLIKDL